MLRTGSFIQYYSLLIINDVADDFEVGTKDFQEIWLLYETEHEKTIQSNPEFGPGVRFNMLEQTHYWKCCYKSKTVLTIFIS